MMAVGSPTKKRILRYRVAFAAGTPARIDAVGSVVNSDPAEAIANATNTLYCVRFHVERKIRFLMVVVPKVNPDAPVPHGLPPE